MRFDRKEAWSKPVNLAQIPNKAALGGSPRVSAVGMWLHSKNKMSLPATGIGKTLFISSLRGMSWTRIGLGDSSRVGLRSARKLLAKKLNCSIITTRQRIEEGHSEQGNSQRSFFHKDFHWLVSNLI
jgi:hypothetical protein